MDKVEQVKKILDDVYGLSPADLREVHRNFKTAKQIVDALYQKAESKTKAICEVAWCPHGRPNMCPPDCNDAEIKVVPVSQPKPTDLLTHIGCYGIFLEARRSYLLATSYKDNHAQEAATADGCMAVAKAQLKACQDYYQPVIDGLRQENEQLKAIMKDLTDPDDCNIDHHGYCQTHGWLQAGVCPHFKAKMAVKE